MTTTARSRSASHEPRLPTSTVARLPRRLSRAIDFARGVAAKLALAVWSALAVASCPRSATGAELWTYVYRGTPHDQYVYLHAPDPFKPWSNNARIMFFGPPPTDEWFRPDYLVKAGAGGPPSVSGLSAVSVQSWPAEYDGLHSVDVKFNQNYEIVAWNIYIYELDQNGLTIRLWSQSGVTGMERAWVSVTNGYTIYDGRTYNPQGFWYPEATLTVDYEGAGASPAGTLRVGWSDPVGYWNLQVSGDMVNWANVDPAEIEADGSKRSTVGKVSAAGNMFYRLVSRASP